MRLAIVIRGSEVLAPPVGAGKDPLPTVDEVNEMMTIVESVEYGDYTVVTSAAGNPVGDWRWVPVVELQAERPEIADALGEALLCA